MEQLTHISMLLMEENGTRSKIYNFVNQYAEVNNKYRKDHDEKDPLYLILYMDEKHHKNTGAFEWVESMSKFIEDIYLKLMLNILKDCRNLKIIYHFYQKEWKLISVKNLCTIWKIKKICCRHKIFKTSIR